ncbi:MAG: inositol monophosphatase family protein [Parvibaculaceae bacterium]
MAQSAHLTVMINAVRKAARGVQRDFGEIANLQVSVKGPGNYVTAADKRCEKVIREELEKARPGYSFLMEESGSVTGSDKEHRWIIDPIDGTTNFIHSIPFFALTVALERKGDLLAAVTYNPISDELFTAERGQGAFLNNRRLRVAARKTLADSVVAWGIPNIGDEERHVQFQREIARIQAKVSGVRQIGSAALELAYVAAGRIDVMRAGGLNPWDCAAGILMVREAGGVSIAAEGEKHPFETGTILAGNADLVPLIKAEIAEARKAAD